MNDEVAQRKATLRTLIRRRRARRRAEAGDADWAKRGERIARTVLALPTVQAAIQDATPIGVYQATATEPPTCELIRRLLAGGASVVVPVAVPSHPLLWVPAVRPDAGGGTTRRRPALAGRELRELRCSLVITPALAVGRDHSRLGQGGGYFDRLIASIRSTQSGGSPAAAADPVTFLALVGPDEVLDTVPTDQLDQPVNGWCVG